jgi:hypothetical protein
MVWGSWLGLAADFLLGSALILIWNLQAWGAHVFISRKEHGTSRWCQRTSHIHCIACITCLTWRRPV